MNEDIKRKPKYIWLGLSGLVAVFTLTIGVFVLIHKKPFIPTAIRKQLTFSVFVPASSSDFTPDQKSLNFSQNTKQLTFHVKRTNGADLLLSMQATPQEFTDVPQVYEQLISKFNQYSSFDSALGTVYLTHPKELNGGQTAVMNSKGTLLFVKPNKDLSDDEWKLFFNSLVISQV